MSNAAEWVGTSGDAWAERWRETDQALANLATVLDSALVEAAPAGPFRAFDVGCGAGSTSLKLASARPDATIIGCDLSAALVAVARTRGAGNTVVRFLEGDAEQIAVAERPFDLIFSRHGVMFFPDPVGAFRNLRAAARAGAAMVFSCFQSWEANPWASELASAAAGHSLPAPGREASGFAFADPAYVGDILTSAGWADLEWRPTPFRYVAGEGEDAVDQALSFLAEIGPASRLVRELPEADRPAALLRMRAILERHCRDGLIEFPAAAWIWTARAPSDA